MGLFSSPAPDYRPLARAQRYAADLQYKTSQEERAYQEKIRQENIKRMQPWVDMGRWALEKIRAGNEAGIFDAPEWRPPDAETFKKDPGYEFRMREQERVLRRTAALEGGIGSGRHLKQVAKFAGEFGADEYDRAYNRALRNYAVEVERRHQNYGRLAQESGLGMQQANAISTLSQQSAGAQSSLAMHGAAALGAGAVGAESALVQGQIAKANAKQQGFSNMMQVLGLGLTAWGIHAGAGAGAA